MADAIHRELFFFWLYFSTMLEQIFKFWFFGMIIGSLVSVFAKEKIHALFTALHSKKIGILGLIPAALLGIASPLCMYGTIPIAASFAQKGNKEKSPSIEGAQSIDGTPSIDGALAAFMMSSILLNPQLMFYTAALGHLALALRFILSLLCGITAGVLVKLFFEGKNFFNFSGFEAPRNRDTDKNLFLRFIKNFGRNVKATGLFFLAGIVLSALFQRYVPPDIFTLLFGGNRGFGILMATTIGVPMYVCGGGTIPLIQSWMLSGMSLGAAVSFMIAGPAMKITNLGALKIVLGIKHFVLYLLFAFAFAFLSGLIVDLVLGMI